MKAAESCGKLRKAAEKHMKAAKMRKCGNEKMRK
jgi:hypothetical protein